MGTVTEEGRVGTTSRADGLSMRWAIQRGHQHGPDWEQPARVDQRRALGAKEPGVQSSLLRRMHLHKLETERIHAHFELCLLLFVLCAYVITLF